MSDFMLNMAAEHFGIVEADTQALVAALPDLQKLIAIMEKMEPLVQQALPIITKYTPLIKRVTAAVQIAEKGFQ